MYCNFNSNAALWFQSNTVQCGFRGSSAYKTTGLVDHYVNHYFANSPLDILLHMEWQFLHLLIQVSPPPPNRPLPNPTKSTSIKMMIPARGAGAGGVTSHVALFLVNDTNTHSSYLPGEAWICLKNELTARCVRLHPSTAGEYFIPLLVVMEKRWGLVLGYKSCLFPPPPR